MRTVDVSYGGENGFNQAIELVADDLQNVKFIQEKKLICEFLSKFNQFYMFYSLLLRRDQQRYGEVLFRHSGHNFGPGAGSSRETHNLGAFGRQTICIQKSDYRSRRAQVSSSRSGLKSFKIAKTKISKIKERDRSHHMQDGVELEVQDCTEFIEWLVETDERFVYLE